MNDSDIGQRLASHPKTADFWNRSGAGKAYDREFSDLIGWYVNASETRPVVDLIGHLSSQKVLDAGCGTGRHLALFNSDCDLYGIDFSNEMIAEAAKRIPQAKFKLGSIDALPFEDKEFDLVLSSRVLQHLRDQKKAVLEMARVCKVGGRVILLSYNSWSFLCLYKQLRMSRIAKVLNIPLRALLGRRSFLNPWGFEYDNYCSAFELTKWMKEASLEIETRWGVTAGQPWFWNDFFMGKILQKVTPTFFGAFLHFVLFLDRTLARRFPLSLFSDKVLVVGVKRT